MNKKKTLEDLLVGYINTSQAGEHLGISRKRITQLIHAGRLPAIKLGTDFFIDPSDLKLVENRKNGRPKKK